ncbi:YqgE/AlgH family protein [Candidatus Similichlamydia epinepheli]|uniref:YqgE/AlgH family protein n=1 Tax=Candidatus Similichlamydia epinepheli TaxID=1903953 RepID=UPI001EFC4FA1|nr:YqgE/AlgH family protein [Candidatus Similichlamydia epinepheli]
MPHTRNLEKGVFLIAAPDIDSGAFFRSVILLCEHSPSGSFGLMINKPLDLEIPEGIAHELPMESGHLSIRAGGPVQTDQVMILHDLITTHDSNLKISDRIFLGSDLKLLREKATGKDNLHLYFGYTGWASGQLERETFEENWYVHPASHRYVFEVPEKKYGKHYSRIWEDASQVYQQCQRTST